MSEYLEFAKKLAIKVGKLSLDHFNKKKHVSTKKDNSFVSEIDVKVETIIKNEIKKKYPAHSVVGEEKGLQEHDSEYLWIIDPIDGTHNYVRQMPLYGVSIGLAKNKKPIAGVIYLPVFDELYYAEKGKGAYCNGKKIRVAGKQEQYVISHQSRPRGLFEKYMNSVSKLTHNGVHLRIIGCATVSQVWIAKGLIDGVVEFQINPWDIAAGWLIIEEAGGIVRGVNGQYKLGEGFYLAGSKPFVKKVEEVWK